MHVHVLLLASARAHAHALCSMHHADADEYPCACSMLMSGRCCCWCMRAAPTHASVRLDSLTSATVAVVPALLLPRGRPASSPSVAVNAATSAPGSPVAALALDDKEAVRQLSMCPGKATAAWRAALSPPCPSNTAYRASDVPHGSEMFAIDHASSHPRGAPPAPARGSRQRPLGAPGGIVSGVTLSSKSLERRFSELLPSTGSGWRACASAAVPRPGIPA